MFELNVFFFFFSSTAIVPYFDYALDVILDLETPNQDDLTEEQLDVIESAAEMLYGCIHARFVCTNRGLAAMVCNSFVVSLTSFERALQFNSIQFNSFILMYFLTST